MSWRDVAGLRAALTPAIGRPCPAERPSGTEPQQRDHVEYRKSLDGFTFRADQNPDVPRAGAPYAVTHAAKHAITHEVTVDSTNAIADALERAPLTVRALLGEMPTALLTRRPRPGKWSAHEHACHIALVDPIFRARLDRMLAEDAPLIVSYNPDADEAPDALLRMDLAESLAAFTHHRATFVERVRALAPADWARQAEHTEHSHYSVFVMLRHLALHDMLHAYRIEELLLNKAWAAEHGAASGGA